MPKQNISTFQGADRVERGNLPFQPETTRATGQEVEVTENSRPAILVIQKFVHEKMYSSSEGIDREVSHIFSKGIHIVVATPGRLIDMLKRQRFTLDGCKYLCMDEADRMVDLGFEDDVRSIMSFFKVCPL